MGDLIPLCIPLAGAIGAVTCALHHRQRDRLRWAAVPVLGAIFGTVAVLVLLAVIQSTGTVPAALSGVRLAAYLLVAFGAGWRAAGPLRRTPAIPGATERTASARAAAAELRAALADLEKADAMVAAALLGEGGEGG